MPHFGLVCLGVGTAIAATEVQRYAVLWPVSARSTDSYALLLVLLAVVLGAMALRGEGRPGRSARHGVLTGAIVIASLIGVSMRMLMAAEILPDLPATRLIANVGMEAPYLLMVLWARHLIRRVRGCGWSLQLVMRSVALGIVFAGIMQMAVSLLAGTAIAPLLAFALAPVSGASLLRLANRVEKSDDASLTSTRQPMAPGVSGGPGVFAAPAVRPSGSTPDAPNMPKTRWTGDTSSVPSASVVQDGTRPLTPVQVGLMGGLVAVASLAVYIIHAQWTGIQDGGSTSLLVQVCTGLGMLLAGSLLLLASERLGTGADVVDLCLVIVLAVSPTGLYLSQTLDGVTLAMSVVPLNIVYATLLFLVWVMPLVVSTQIGPGRLSLLLFFLKRASVMAGPLLVGATATLGLGLVWLTFGAMVLLAVLYVALFLSTRIRTEGSDTAHDAVKPEFAASPSADPAERHRDVCRDIARSFGLTPREGETFLLLARGRTARYIAAELGMSDATVKTHIAHIYRKLGVNSQQALLDIVEKGLRESGQSSRR